MLINTECSHLVLTQNVNTDVKNEADVNKKRSFGVTTTAYPYATSGHALFSGRT